MEGDRKLESIGEKRKERRDAQMGFGGKNTGERERERAGVGDKREKIRRKGKMGQEKR